MFTPFTDLSGSLPFPLMNLYLFFLSGVLYKGSWCKFTATTGSSSNMHLWREVSYCFSALECWMSCTIAQLSTGFISANYRVKSIHFKRLLVISSYQQFLWALKFYYLALLYLSCGHLSQGGLSNTSGKN